jgi:hypothetical protein
VAALFASGLLTCTENDVEEGALTWGRGAETFMRDLGDGSEEM